MATNFSGIKQILDLPSWQPTPIIYSAVHVAAVASAGSVLVGDLRASQYKQQLLWFLQNSTTLYQYRTKGNGWVQLLSPALAGTFGAGACGIFCPSLGPRGVIAAGATTTSIILSTALQAAVGINQLAGQRLRVINNIAGGGQTVERTIVANTAGTTPTITVDAAFGFTPGTGVTYEILSGRLYLMGAGTTAAGIWKFYDVATNSMSANLSTTNLPATIGPQSTIISLDELHTPITGVGGVAINGEVGGFFGTLNETGVSATTLTGQASGGDATVAANEYRNFQIRIVEDLVNPTAVGQRRRITSHTAGPSPVYTVPTWTVTPSTSAKYVIENNNDIILWTAAATTTYRFDPIAGTWDTTTYAVKPAANAAGSIAFQPFGAVLNAAKTIRHSYIYNFRGGAGVNLDVLDIAAGATGVWTAGWVYDNQGTTQFNTSAGAEYSVIDNKLIAAPVSLLNAQTNMYYFDVDLNSLRSYTPCQQISGTVTDGNRMALDFYIDGTDKKAFVYWIPSSLSYMLRSLFIN